MLKSTLYTGQHNWTFCLIKHCLILNLFSVAYFFEGLSSLLASCFCLHYFNLFSHLQSIFFLSILCFSPLSVSKLFLLLSTLGSVPGLCAAAVFAALLWAPSPSFTKVATTSASLPISSLLSCVSNLPAPPHPPQCLVDWVVQSCQSLAGPAKLHVLARGETRANGRGIVVGPFNLPPLSSGPPQQIELPAGQHGAHRCPMLRAHMPQSTNSHLHMNMHSYTNMCMYGDTCLTAHRHMQTNIQTPICSVLTHSLIFTYILWKKWQVFPQFFVSFVENFGYLKKAVWLLQGLVKYALILLITSFWIPRNTV